MDVIAIINGLGNQMSGYAFYLQKKKMGQSPVLLCYNTDHNGIELEKLFGIECENKTIKQKVFSKILMILLKRTRLNKRIESYIRRVLFKLGIKIYIEFKDKTFHPEYLETGRRLKFYYGSWTSEKYMQDITDEIKKLYTFPPFNDDKNIDIENQIAGIDNAVAIHIRRGDYLKGNNYKYLGRVCDENFYLKAINVIEKKISSPIYYVFSNDIEWSKNFMKERNAIFIDWNQGNDSWKDMALMSKFKNIIIPNSTFSWWSAWLNGNNKFVVCPECVIYGIKENDFYPSYWNKIQ